jgi:uncharacterized membrane protein
MLWLVSEQFKQLGIDLGANGLPYRFPLHPNFVHLTLGLFIIAIAFDFAGTLFPLERPILKFFSMPVSRFNFFDVAWYNIVAASVISFFTVAAGLFELLLANPPTDMKSVWGLDAGTTMLLHGVGGVLLLTLIVAMTVSFGEATNAFVGAKAILSRCSGVTCWWAFSCWGLCSFMVRWGHS